MKILVQQFYLSLAKKRVTPDELASAHQVMVERLKWFPTLADVIEAVDAVRALQPNHHLRRADIEWKANFPELCSPSEALLLGISEEEVARARREQLPAGHPVKKHLKLIGNGGPNE